MGPNYVCTGMGGELTRGAVDYRGAPGPGRRRRCLRRRRMKNWDAPSAPAVVVNFAVCDLHDQRAHGPGHGVSPAPTRRGAASKTPTRAGTSSASRRSSSGAPARRLRRRPRPRAWHAGTVNVTADELRPLPNVGRAGPERAGARRRCRRASTRASTPRAGASARASSTTSPTGLGWRAEHPRGDGWALGNRDAQRGTASTRPPRPPSPSSRRTTTASSTPACAAPSPRRTPTPATRLPPGAGDDHRALCLRAGQRRRRRPARPGGRRGVPGAPLHRPARPPAPATGRGPRRPRAARAAVVDPTSWLRYPHTASKQCLPQRAVPPVGSRTSPDRGLLLTAPVRFPRLRDPPPVHRDGRRAGPHPGPGLPTRT